MDKQYSFRDFFSFGLAASLSWHFFWIFLFHPVINYPFGPLFNSENIFLGSVLKKSDLSVVSIQSKRIDTGSSLEHKDLARADYFNRLPYSVYKPEAKFTQPDFVRSLPEETPEVQLPMGEVEDISFDFSEAQRYLGNIDLSDLKRMLSREELATVVAFKVLLRRGGEVAAIEKTIGSGDPALDLFMMRKLKNAVFKDPLPEGVWLKVNIKIK